MDYHSFIPLIAALLLGLITFWLARRSSFTVRKTPPAGSSRSQRRTGLAA